MQEWKRVYKVGALEYKEQLVGTLHSPLILNFVKKSLLNSKE